MHIQSPSDERWKEIYKNYVPVLYNYGCKIINDPAVVEDCIQDVFVELWENSAKMADIRCLKAYLFKILRRKIMAHLDHDKKQFLQKEYVRESDFKITFSFETMLIEKELLKDQKRSLKLALGTLTNRQREAIFLKFYEGHSYNEVADIMKLEKSAVYTLVYKAMSQLRNALKKSGLHATSELQILRIILFSFA